jgi:L-ascorbate metabolism protein UlaG (beta-lactamase superfamily)
MERTSPTSPLAELLTRGAVQNSGTSLWWLGQAGFAIESDGTTILIDPYLSDSLAEKYRGTLFPHRRLVGPPIVPSQVRRCDLYLCTHGHTDHMDPLTIQGVLEHASPTFVVPRAELAKARERGIPADHVVGMSGDDSELVSGIRIDAVPAAHEELEVDGEGSHRFLGYVLELGGVRLYHSGDCVPYRGQAKRLADLNVEIALLPINGRDAYRRNNGVPGNFTVTEAVELCREAGIPRLIGHHFGMFDFNTVDRGCAERALRGAIGEISWLLPEIGVQYRLTTEGVVQPVRGA